MSRRCWLRSKRPRTRSSTSVANRRGETSYGPRRGRARRPRRSRSSDSRKDAERRLLEDQDRLAQSETDTAIALVAVYKALGGGVGDGEPGCESGFLTVSDLGWMEGFSDLPSFHVEDGKSILIRWVPSSVCKPYLTGWMVPILRSGNSLPPIARIAPPFWWAVPTLPG
jgi:hypothetical protein